MEAPGNVQQYIFHRDAVRQFEEQRWQLFLAFGDDGGGEQRLLVVEMTVDRQLRHAGLASHRVHAGVGVAMAEKQGFRRIQDRLAFGQILGAARAVWS